MIGEQKSVLIEAARAKHQRFVSSLEPTRLADFEMKKASKILDPSLQFSPQNKNICSDDFLWKSNLI
jgi:hypothetical protein